MAISITNPAGTKSPVSPDQPVYLKAVVTLPDREANLVWEAKVNGGSFTIFAAGTDEVTYQPPSSVSNADGSGNKSVDILTIKARDRSTGNSDEVELVLVQDLPMLNRTTVTPPVTSTVSEPPSSLSHKSHPGGPADVRRADSGTPDQQRQRKHAKQKQVDCSKPTNHVDWKSILDTDLRNAAIESAVYREEAWTELVRRFESRVSSAVRGALSQSGCRPQTEVIEELVEAAWVRAAGGNCKVLRAWNPNQGSLGVFLARMGMWEALTWHRYAAKRREVSLSSKEFKGMAGQDNSNLAPEQIAWLKEAEQIVTEWEARLKPIEQELLRRCRVGESQRFMGSMLGLTQPDVSCILGRLRHDLETILQ
ncbi:MAG: hypothetical protein HY665_04000 [Chloroflexi bacterium]|nr:hypothetical protein [Chloroflexota bacterium]